MELIGECSVPAADEQSHLVNSENKFIVEVWNISKGHLMDVLEKKPAEGHAKKKSVEGHDKKKPAKGDEQMIISKSLVEILPTANHDYICFKTEEAATLAIQKLKLEKILVWGSIKFIVQVSNIPSQVYLTGLLRKLPVHETVEMCTERHALICFNTEEDASEAIKKLKTDREKKSQPAPEDGVISSMTVAKNVQFGVQVPNIPRDQSKSYLMDLLNNKSAEGHGSRLRISPVKYRKVEMNTERHATIYFETEKAASDALERFKCKNIKDAILVKIHTIDNQEQYITFIKELRAMLAKHNDSEDIFDYSRVKKEEDNRGKEKEDSGGEKKEEDNHGKKKEEEAEDSGGEKEEDSGGKKEEDSSGEKEEEDSGGKKKVEDSGGKKEEDIPETMAHPLLTTTKPSGVNRLGFFTYIMIAVGEGISKGEAPVLAIQKDNVYIKGFRNQKRQWFELPGRRGDNDEAQDLKQKHWCAKKLEGWDGTYPGTMNLETREVNKTLMSARLGKGFAMRALRRLWNYDPNPKNDDNPTRHGLAGLFVMISEAARMDPFLYTIAGGWNSETGLPKELATKMRRDWGSMSAAVIKWKKSSYREWPSKLGDALAFVRLVRAAEYVTGPAPWVEIFAVDYTPQPAGHREHRFKITGEGNVFPNKEAREKDMDEKHGTFIAAHDWFSISVVGSTTEPLRFYCGEKDRSRNQPVKRTLEWGDKKLEVTYLAMSDAAMKATVNVEVAKVDSEDRPGAFEKWDHEAPERPEKKYTVSKGEIFARISDYYSNKDEWKIKLLSSEENCETETIGGKLLLKLPRRDVMVPRGKQLHVYVENLVIKTDDSKNEVPNINGCKKFSFNFLSPTANTTESYIIDNSPGPSLEVIKGATQPAVSSNFSNIVGVDISWDTDDASRDTETKAVPWTIGDTGSFTEFIKKLRAHISDNFRDDPAHKDYPVLLIKRHAALPDQWTHIKMQVKDEKSSITLAIREDILFGVGFMNQAGVWYSLTSLSNHSLLGRKYNSVHLNWGSQYTHLRQGTEMKELIMKKLGKEFAQKAVRTLSRYPDVGDEDEQPPRLALLGLMIMVCESAIWKPLEEYIEKVWDKNECDAEREEDEYIIDIMTRCIPYWDVVSRRRLRRKEDFMSIRKSFSKIFVSKDDADKAIEGIQLVYNPPRLPAQPPAGDKIITEIIEK